MRYGTLKKAISCCLISSVILLAVGFTPAADPVSFEGETVRVLISERTGGGTDTAGRLLAGFLPKYLPGNPQTIVQNMPGGGGISGANYLALQTKSNGLLVGQFDTTIISPMVLRRDVVKYDLQKFEAVGALNRGGTVLFVRKEDAPRLTDPSAEPVIVGATDGNRYNNAMVLWGAEFLGWNIKYIVGYPGTSALMKAFLQGEIEMTATGNAFILKDMEKEGVAKLLAQSGDTRRQAFPNVPTFAQVLGDKKPSGVAWQAYLAWVGPSHIDKWMALPPGTPAAIVQTYRNAFNQVTKDPEFLKLAQKQLSADVRPIPGQKVEEILKEVSDVSDEALEYGAMLRKKYGLPEWKG